MKNTFSVSIVRPCPAHRKSRCRQPTRTTRHFQCDGMRQKRIPSRKIYCSSEKCISDLARLADYVAPVILSLHRFSALPKLSSADSSDTTTSTLLHDLLPRPYLIVSSKHAATRKNALGLGLPWRGNNAPSLCDVANLKQPCDQLSVEYHQCRAKLCS